MATELQMWKKKPSRENSHPSEKSEQNWGKKAKNRRARNKSNKVNKGRQAKNVAQHPPTRNTPTNTTRHVGREMDKSQHQEKKSPEGLKAKFWGEDSGFSNKGDLKTENIGDVDRSQRHENLKKGKKKGRETNHLFRGSHKMS